MNMRKEWVNPEVYREARRQGFFPAYAAWLGRPPVVELVSDPNVSAWDGGTFDYEGETFTYRVDWEDDCLCREMEDEDPEWREYEHRFLTVSFGDREALLGSVCGDRRTWLGSLADDRFMAASARDLADEILAGRARETAELWAEAGR